MIDELDIVHFLSMVDPKDIRVHQPTSVFLICGGPQGTTLPVPPSLREAYLRICDRGALKKHSAMLAEDLTRVFDLGNYRDFLALEADIAEISSLILLFSESYGSAAELGAFTITPSIASKLCAVIDDKRYGENSFIKLGPLRFLHNNYGEASVCVINRKDIGTNDINNLSSLNFEAFHEIISTSIEDRLKTIKSHSTFDKSQNGHIIKLIVGIIQWYGALTLDEVEVCLLYFNLGKSRSDVENFLLCAEFFNWIVKHKRGSRTYYVAIAKNAAVQFSFFDDSQKPNKSKWQTDVREQWKLRDPMRFNCIVDAQLKAI
ncbi:hypothetical protein FZC33_13845 [Labrys sp. KNU-23]|uniref:retron St85 family effector protein n=1 Tax=Labrys sp. KNU-23 TaxID=2789216 RepID=UPI0011ED5423|nr:retron St85 family effector protein [Labrys sp. KNU-23]QEN87342.1 hypothetical protein FZC33_13845 [Labrys sp. KNU-23]